MRFTRKNPLLILTITSILIANFTCEKNRYGIEMYNATDQDIFVSSILLPIGMEEHEVSVEFMIKKDSSKFYFFQQNELIPYLDGIGNDFTVNYSFPKTKVKMSEKFKTRKILSFGVKKITIDGG